MSQQGYGRVRARRMRRGPMKPYGNPFDRPDPKSALPTINNVYSRACLPQIRTRNKVIVSPAGYVQIVNTRVVWGAASKFTPKILRSPPNCTAKEKLPYIYYIYTYSLFGVTHWHHLYYISAVSFATVVYKAYTHPNSAFQAIWKKCRDAKNQL